jgi:deoxyribonuclease V
MPNKVSSKSHLHSWDVTPEQAIAIQNKLRRHVVTENQPSSVNTVAGVDVGFPDPQTARAAVVVLRFPELAALDYAVTRVPVEFPYIPGLLAFREIPALLAAVEKLHTLPDLFIFDAHGLAHPRRLGLASHAGLLLDRPSIGCAKSRLTGKHAEPESERGNWVPLMDGDERIGAVVRTRTGVKPVYVSIGHKVNLATAIRYVLDCAPRYRLPETTRYAHKAASGAKIDLNISQQPSLF